MESLNRSNLVWVGLVSGVSLVHSCAVLATIAAIYFRLQTVVQVGRAALLSL